MNDIEIRNRLIDLEMAIDNQQKMLNDLNEVVIWQSKIITQLTKNYDNLRQMLDTDVVKPLPEETPPPHY